MQNPKLKTDSKSQPFKWFIIFYAIKNETIINIRKKAKGIFLIMIQISCDLFVAQLFLGHKQIIILKKEWTYTLVFDQSSF